MSCDRLRVVLFSSNTVLRSCRAAGSSAFGNGIPIVRNLAKLTVRCRPAPRRIPRRALCGIRPVSARPSQPTGSRRLTRPSLWNSGAPVKP